MYLFRSNESVFFESCERSLITVILGPRRVGKTTLIQHYHKKNEKRKWALLNMDIRSERIRIANEELEQIIEEKVYQQIGGTEKIWVFIDEAQKCPELFDQIKILYDKHKGTDKIKFILTGSAHLNLHQLSAETLAGRVDLLHLREFNLRESAQVLYPDLEIPGNTVWDALFLAKDPKKVEELFRFLRPFQNPLNDTIATLLVWGGLPEVLQETEEKNRLKYLNDYLQTYLEKDVRAIESIGDLVLYQNLMKICAEQTGSIRDDKKITEALHCSRNTLHKYRGYFLATLQYFEVYPFIGSSVKRLVKSPKGYISNNGLVSFLTGVKELSILKTTGLIGHRFENWFFNEVQAWLDRIPSRHEIYFWRTFGGVEVDFIVDVAGDVFPFEITYTKQKNTKKIRHLISFMNNEPKVPFGVYVYSGPFHYDQQNRIIFLPSWMY